MSDKRLQMAKSAIERCRRYAEASRTENEDAIVVLGEQLEAVTRERDEADGTITSLCDRIELLSRLAHDETLSLAERLEKIKEWSGGFMRPPQVRR